MRRKGFGKKGDLPNRLACCAKSIDQRKKKKGGRVESGNLGAEIQGRAVGSTKGNASWYSRPDLQGNANSGRRTLHGEFVMPTPRIRSKEDKGKTTGKGTRRGKVQQGLGLGRAAGDGSKMSRARTFEN